MFVQKRTHDSIIPAKQNKLVKTYIHTHRSNVYKPFLFLGLIKSRELLLRSNCLRFPAGYVFAHLYSEVSVQVVGHSL